MYIYTCYICVSLCPLCYHSPSALHFNIPLWYSSPHKCLETLSPSHPRLSATRRPSDLTHNSRVHSVLSVSCRDWDYSQTAQQECLRLNTGVMVTPLTTDTNPKTSLSSLSAHPRPGPASSPATAGTENWMPFFDYLSPRKNTVSYTAVLPAGQDPKSVFLGWTTAQFYYMASQFQTGGAWSSVSDVYGQRLECVNRHKSHTGADPTTTTVKYSNSSAYMVCVKELLSTFADQNLAVSLRYMNVY